MKHLPVRISDHAVLRYLERVGGFEIEALRAQLAARVAKNAAPGISSILIDGHRYMIRHNEQQMVVTSVLKAEMHGRPDLEDQR